MNHRGVETPHSLLHSVSLLVLLLENAFMDRGDARRNLDFRST